LDYFLHTFSFSIHWGKEATKVKKCLNDRRVQRELPEVKGVKGDKFE
jgi:hypothetical protein